MFFQQNPYDEPYCGLVAQWITRLPTEQKIPGSSPGKIDSFLVSFYFLSFHNFIAFIKTDALPLNEKIDYQCFLPQNYKCKHVSMCTSM